jgi:hypothetical protein
MPTTPPIRTAASRAVLGLDGCDAGVGVGVFETPHGSDEAALLVGHRRHAAAIFYGTAERAFLSDW